MRRVGTGFLLLGVASMFVGCGLDRSALMPSGSDAGAGAGGAAGATGKAGAAGGAPGTAGGASGSGGETGGASGTAGGASGSGGASMCPALGCDPFCPSGVKVDANGCQTCQCNPVVCPAIACATKCAYGVKTDANGCATCECNPPPVCGPVCAIFCAYGNVVDAQGCPTCTCNPPPKCDATQCPKPAPGAANYVCPDGKTIAGPACVPINGGCGWTFVSCPPPASGGCGCPLGQVCVQQIGGPAIAAYPPPAPACETPDPGCLATIDAIDPSCACLSKSDGACKPSGTARTCTCDNGIR